VLADAEALLTCYGVGEESGAELLHAVVELCFTSSVRFLQPGLLLKVGFSPICHLHLTILFCQCNPCLLKELVINYLFISLMQLFMWLMWVTLWATPTAVRCPK